MLFQVRHGLDHFLFMLLVAGGLCDSRGRVWRRNPQDLYVVEITQYAQTKEEKVFRPAYKTINEERLKLPSIIRKTLSGVLLVITCGMKG